MRNWKLELLVVLAGILWWAASASALDRVEADAYMEPASSAAGAEKGETEFADGVSRVLGVFAPGTSGRLLAGGMLMLAGLRLLELAVRFVAAVAATGGMWGVLWLTERLHGSPLPLWIIVALLAGAGSVGWQVARMEGSSVGEWLARGLALLGTLGISTPLAHSLGIEPATIVLAAGASSLASPALGVAILAGGMVGTAIPEAGPFGACAALMFSIIWTRMLLGPRGWFGPVSFRPSAGQ